MAEGSVWEALDAARRHSLTNFTAIVDVNRLGQRGPTELEWDLDAYARRVEAFGARAIQIDGHDLEQIEQAMLAAKVAVTPTVILARTHKGRGFSEVEDKPGWHGKPLPADMAERAVDELGGDRDLRVPGADRGRSPTPGRRAGRQAPQARARGASALRRARDGRSPQGVRRHAGRIGRCALRSWSSTARWATPPTPTSSPKSVRSGSSRATSPNSRWWPPRSGCPPAATGLSRPRSARS